MTMNDNQKMLLHILSYGSLPNSPDNPDLAAEGIISVLANAAYQTPKDLLVAIKDVVQVRIDSMVMVAMANLFAYAPDEFFTANILNTILSIMDIYEPPLLLEFVLILQERDLGKGFGSRPQKLIRAVMETWMKSTVDTYCNHFPNEMTLLAKKVHPRIPSSGRGESLAKLLGKNRKELYH